MEDQAENIAHRLIATIIAISNITFVVVIIVPVLLML